MSEGPIKRIRAKAPAAKTAGKAARQSAAKAPSKAAEKRASRQMWAEQAGLLFESPDDIICGVDEAGRGPLAGPVVVAAVILDPARPIRGLDDSKQLNEAVREKLHDRILERALAHCVVFVERDEIDRINIFQATMVGMTRALMGLSLAPQIALVDGNRLPRTLPCEGRAVIGGDASERRAHHVSPPDMRPLARSARLMP